MQDTRFQMYTYKRWLESLPDPAEWLAATRDQSGKEIWFTAAQFWKYLPPVEEFGILRAHYAIREKPGNYVEVSFFHEEIHPTLVCRWYHLSTLENVCIDISEGHFTKDYAARVAMVVEAGSLDTTNDYYNLKRYCQNYLYEHHEKLRGCAMWEEYEFTEAWIAAYAAAAVRRMRVMATNRPDAINTFIVTPNLAK